MSNVDDLTLEIQRRNFAQIWRFIKSGMELEEFLNQPEEVSETLAMDALAAQRDRMRPYQP